MASRGPGDRVNIRILHSNIKGMPEIRFCRILVFMWSFGALASYLYLQ